MKTSELHFSYPERLIGLEPAAEPRVLVNKSGLNHELQMAQLLDLFGPGDVLVINDTKVEARRVFSQDGLEVLFLRSEEDGLLWEVLFPARGLKVGAKLAFPGELEAELAAKGLPQKLRLSRPISAEFFEEFGELALPPYIQAARDERHNREADKAYYQTAWAKNSGSCAAPTASLHFKEEHLEELKSRGVKICPITLHVGLGTFAPVKSEHLADHPMHFEKAILPKSSLEEIEKAENVWALGTTVMRSLESWKLGLLKETTDAVSGETDLFIRPGFEFQCVNRLLTNFHQPESTLLALVCAFAGKENVFNAYEWVIEKEFRLFSYGDLSVWYPQGEF